MEKLRIIVGGYIGLYPTGGATWDYIQYPLGLKLLGHDVYYFEDTAVYPMYQSDGDKWNDCSDTVRFIKTAMENVGLGERWACASRQHQHPQHERTTQEETVWSQGCSH